MSFDFQSYQRLEKSYGLQANQRRLLLVSSLSSCCGFLFLSIRIIRHVVFIRARIGGIIAKSSVMV